MLEQLQWFLAVIAVIVAAVAIGAAVFFMVDLATGGVKRAARLRRNAMPERVSKLMKG